MTAPIPRDRCCPRCGSAEIERIRIPVAADTSPAGRDRRKAKRHERDRCLRCAWPDSPLSTGGRRWARSQAIVKFAPANSVIMIADASTRRHYELICRDLGRLDIRVVCPTLRRAGRPTSGISLDEYAQLSDFNGFFTGKTE